MNKLKLSVLVATLVTTSGLTYAQAPVSPTINAPEKAGLGNSAEKELTPLLRDISKKRSQLELKKLDRELSKLEDEEMKAQLEMEIKTREATAPVTPPAGMPSTPLTPTSASITPSATIAPMEADSDIKVLMIYGFDENLSAKIAAGAQGGYVVKKGDVMPDGRVVTKITANYLEVKRNKSKANGVSRIFVSSGEVPQEKGAGKLNAGVDSTNGIIPTTKISDPIPGFDKLPAVDQTNIKNLQNAVSSFKGANQITKTIK